MGTVVALDQFRRMQAESSAAAHQIPRKPQIVGAQIWSADYTSIDGVVFGLLKAREIASYYFGVYDEEFDQLLVEALDKAYHIEQLGDGPLKRAIAPLKEIMAAMINEDNRKPLSLGLVILDLIEKAPAYVRS